MEYDIESILEMYEDDYNPDPRPMNQGPRNMYNQGQLVSNTVDGSRPGYSGALTAKQQQKIIEAFPDTVFDFDTYPMSGAKKYLTSDQNKANPDHTKVERFKKKGFTLEMGKGLNTRGVPYSKEGKRLSIKDQNKIKAKYDLPEGVKEWNFKTYKYGIKSGGRENLLARMTRTLAEKGQWTLAADFGGPKGWMMAQMQRVYKNESKNPNIKKLTYKPVYAEINGQDRIVGFKDNTVAGKGKTYYGLAKYTKKGAGDWTKHGDWKLNNKLIDISKRSKNAPNEVIMGILKDKGFKGNNVKLNDLIHFLSGTEEGSAANLKNAVVRHHNSGVKFGSATNDISLTTSVINKRIVEAETRIAAGNVLPEDVQLLRNNNVYVRGANDKLYGAGKKSPIGQYKQIESSVAGALESNTDFKGNKFKTKKLNEYLLKLAGTTNEKCKGALAYGGRVALAEGLSPEFCIGEGKKVARDLVAKNIEGTLAQKNMMGKLMTSVKNFAKSILDPRELFDLKKQFFSKGALMSMPIFDGVMAADDALRKNMDPKEAFAKTFLFGSIPETFGITKGVDVLQAEKMLNNSNLSPAGKAYAQAIIDTDEYKKLSTSSIQTSPEMVNAVQKKLKELENNIAGKQGGRFDYESAIAEMQGTFKAKPKENKFFFDDAPDAPDVTPLKNKLAKKAMTRGPMTAKKNQPVDLTPTTYQNFKPNYGFTKEQFEDAMRKEGVLAEDKIYGNNFYKQEIEKPIEFEQLMEVPGFKGTQNNFSEGGITGLRSKYEYKK